MTGPRGVPVMNPYPFRHHPESGFFAAGTDLSLFLQHLNLLTGIKYGKTQQAYIS